MRKGKALVTVTTALVMATVFITLAPGAAFGKSSGPITLNFVSYVNLAHETGYRFFKQEFIDKVNEQAKGELFIKVRGGPEIIKPFDLGVAVKKGNIDIATIPPAFFESLVPLADATKLSDYTAWEERENNIYEYIGEMYKKGGLVYLGRAQATERAGFFMFLNKLIEKPEDFVGLKLGGSTGFHGFYKELGAIPVTVTMGDYYSALERGVVDGITTGLYYGVAFGLVDVSDFVTREGVYIITTVLVCNPDSWNRIPKHLQELMINSMAEYEKKYTPWEKGKRAEAFRKAEAAGSKILTFSPDVAKWYHKAAEEGTWNYLKNRFPDRAEAIAELRERITK